MTDTPQSQASQLPHLDLCAVGTAEDISDKDLGLPLGNLISSLRTPLQMQRSGVAARIT